MLYMTILSIDHDGLPRPGNDGYTDIGAYEDNLT